MDRLTGLIAFVRTSDLGSFAAAGRTLGITASAVGKAVTKLEQQVGVRLFQRSTRSLRLTEEGREFHERCQRILDDLEDAHTALSQTRMVPRGRLTISAPIIAYRLLFPIMSDFIKQYPEIEIELDFTDRIVDLIGERIDVAIRSGSLPDSRLMSRALCPFQMLLCASPEYLEQHGTPQVPTDLATHSAIRFRYSSSGRLYRWPLPSGDWERQLRNVITCNNTEAVKRATLCGLGIGCMPDFIAQDDLKAGNLRTVLNEYIEAPVLFHLLWPSSRHLSPKVRVCVDYLSEKLLSP